MRCERARKQLPAKKALYSLRRRDSKGLMRPAIASYFGSIHTDQAYQPTIRQAQRIAIDNTVESGRLKILGRGTQGMDREGQRQIKYRNENAQP